MSLHGDLLGQAKYYALFHLLTESAARALVSGSGRERDGLRAGLRRAFDRGDMKRLSAPFSGGTAPDPWKPALPGAPLPAELRLVAETFVELQNARHAAEYDPLIRYTRREAQELIERRETAFGGWERVSSTQPSDTFLVALLLHARYPG